MAQPIPRPPRRGLRALLARLTSSNAELEAAEMLDEVVERGGTPIAVCADREQVTVTGTVRTVTIRPRAGVPALEAEIYDGSDSLDVVWLGRRQIRGIDPGRTLVVHGRIARSAGRAVMFNPRYELLPVGQ